MRDHGEMIIERETCLNTVLTFSLEQFRSVCSKQPSTHCSDRIEQDCSMACSPVFWCKVSD